jgi:DNA-binding beta-propeller fold protein YncE
MKQNEKEKIMNLLTHFRKILILPLLSLGVIFALATSAHAQNLYISVNGAICGRHCSDVSGSISEYTPAGMQITIASGLARPRGLAFDSSGNLFAAVNYFAPPNQRHGRILKFPPLGHQSVLGNVALSIIEGLVTDSEGNTFAMAQSASRTIGDVSNIYKFAPDGTRTLFGSVGIGGFDLALDSAGNLYAAVADEQTIYKFTTNGTRSVFAGPSEFAEGEFPVGLAFDSSGNLFVSIETFTDPGADSIVYFTPMGVKSTFATGLTTPRGLAFDGSGYLFVAESNPAPDGDILKFAPGGGAPTVFASGIDLPEFLAFGPPR